MLITPELKDELLDKFVNLDTISFKTSVPLLSDFLSVDRGVVVCLIDHFEEVGLCKVTRLIGGGLCIVLNAKAYDMYRRGGFAAEEYLNTLCPLNCISKQ